MINVEGYCGFMNFPTLSTIFLVLVKIEVSTFIPFRSRHAYLTYAI